MDYKDNRINFEYLFGKIIDIIIIFFWHWDLFRPAERAQSGRKDGQIMGPANLPRLFPDRWKGQ